jgi:hypothetical protein
MEMGPEMHLFVVVLDSGQTAKIMARDIIDARQKTIEGLKRHGIHARVTGVQLAPMPIEERRIA